MLLMCDETQWEKVRWIIAQKWKGESNSAHRVQQIYKVYVETGQLPQVGNSYHLMTRRLSIKPTPIISFGPVTLRL